MFFAEVPHHYSAHTLKTDKRKLLMDQLGNTTDEKKHRRDARRKLRKDYWRGRGKRMIKCNERREESSKYLVFWHHLSGIKRLHRVYQQTEGKVRSFYRRHENNSLLSRDENFSLR